MWVSCHEWVLGLSARPESTQGSGWSSGSQAHDARARRRGRGQVRVQVDSAPCPRPTPQQAVEPGGSLQASDSPWGQDRPVCCENPRRCDPEWSPGAGGPTRQQAPPPCSSKSREKWALPPQLGDEQIEAPTG